MTEHDREWALVQRHDHCEWVRFWWRLWHRNDLLSLDDPTIWGHWRDFNEINRLLEIGHPASPLDVAAALARSSVAGPSP